MQNLVLADKQQLFLQHVLEGETLSDAAKKAGIGVNNAPRDAYPVLMQPEVRRRFKTIIRGKAGTEGLVVAYNYMVELIRDKALDKRLRLDAAKFLYASHMAAPKAFDDETGRENKPLNEMSNEELRTFCDATERELAERAVPIASINAPEKLNL